MLELLNFHIIVQDFLFSRLTSIHSNLLKSIWTNKTQFALEFLNSHIVAHGFSFFTNDIKILYIIEKQMDK